MLITKTQILQGTQYSEQLFVDELGGEVAVRALSDGELTLIESQYIKKLGKFGIKFSQIEEMRQGNIEGLDLSISGELSLIARERQWEMCAKALSVNEEEWTIEDVKMLSGIVIDKISAKAEELSRGTPRQVESFRGIDGGKSPGDTD